MAKAKAKSTTSKLAKFALRRASAAKQVAALKRELATIPAQTHEQTELRALTVFDRLPPGHGTFLVPDNASAPHLRKGEYAVVDITDREVQHGEIYVLQNQSGERHRYIAQTRRDMVNITGPDAEDSAEDSMVWWCGDLRGYRKTNETVAGGIPLFAGLSDGPYLAEDLQPKLVGRIIGVAFSELGNFIAETAGYENEEAGNAAFNPAEYIDVLLASGYRPCLHHNYYLEELPHRRLSDAEHAAVHAVRWKYVAASTAHARVKQECVRRGLVEERKAT